MSYIAKIYPSDRAANAALDRLLAAEGIRRDPHLDYSCGIYDDDGALLATGSCWKNTLRCFAVDAAHRGEALLNTVITHLIDVQAERGNVSLFLYTKGDSARFFRDLGFYEIARAEDDVVFMENHRQGFPSHLDRWRKETGQQPSPAGSDAALISAIVMNANPFTLGHQHLAEIAAARSALLHIFLVSEDASLVPFAVRKRLVAEGIRHLPNAVLHESGPYIISQATFPSYFQKDAASVVSGHARLDLAVFRRIAESLGIQARYVGEEPFSETTDTYNGIMQEELPSAGIACLVVPRLAVGDTLVSASHVRKLLQQSDVEAIRPFVPESTYEYFASEEAIPVLERIRQAANVIHH